MGSQHYWWEDLVGLVGQVALVDRVDSLASLQVGREVRGESMGASLEVQVVGCLVDLEVGRLVDPEVGHLVDPEVGHLVDPEVGRLVDPEVGRLVDPEVGRLVGPGVDHPEGQVADSFLTGQQEVAPGEVGRLGRHENLGQNKIPGSVVGK